MNPQNLPIRYAVRAVLALVFLLTLAAPAAAAQSGTYSLEILVDGVPLDEHLARGTRYVEAHEGREYSLRLRNRTAERIAVALSVDGLNTIDAKHTEGAPGLEVDPRSVGKRSRIDGWQTGSSTARRFFFTTEEKSYGAWLGKTTNLGVISAAVFREKRRPVAIQQPLREKKRAAGSAAGEAGRSKPSAPTESEVREDAAGMDAPQALPSDEMAATGIGREVDHLVRRVRFEAERDPAAVMEVRYEYRETLVRLGVLPAPFAWRDDPLERRERARGFSDSGFAPDPYLHPRR